VRQDPRLLPHFAGKAWRIVRGGRLDKLIERNRMRTDWFSDYAAWAAEHDTKTEIHLALLRERGGAGARPRFGIVVVDDAAGAAARAATPASLARTIHRPRRTCRPATRQPRLQRWRGSLRATTSTVGIFGAGDALAPTRARQIALELAAAPATVLVYADDDEIRATARARPDFKPCWDPYLFAQQPYLLRSARAATRSPRRSLRRRPPRMGSDLADCRAADRMPSRTCRAC
jgi:hypothetical protein